MGWELDSGRPIYAQLAELLRSRIISGQYHPGDRLPSVRELAAEAGVNPNTMQRALADLERENLVYSVRTSGRFITTDQAVLSAAREESARAVTRAYLDGLAALGLTAEDAIQLISAMRE